MIFKISTNEKFDKAFERFDSQTQRILKGWIDKNLMNCVNPCIRGQKLASNSAGSWKYRVGDYRILADIRDDEIVLIFVEVSHRNKIY